MGAQVVEVGESGRSAGCLCADEEQFGVSKDESRVVAGAFAAVFLGSAIGENGRIIGGGVEVEE